MIGAVHRGWWGRRWRRALVVGPLSVLLLAGLVVEGRSVLYFHSVTPWSQPDRMHVCGRDYSRGAHVAARAAEDVVAPAMLRVLARGPLWQPVYGVPGPAGSGAPCDTVLYLPEGTGYRGYALVGGP